jgi:hypothetical protein
MASSISDALRKLVFERAHGRFEYCLLPEAYTAHRHEPDHAIARQHGGATVASNLALACLRCNRYKGPNIASVDADSGDVVALFNPRTQRWTDHFEWDGVQIVARSAPGRATIRLLRLNDAPRLEERRALLRAGVILDSDQPA